MSQERTIYLIDCQSFYASCEKAARPELKHKPVAVGDPDRPSGIILAACPIAKSFGVTTAERAKTALAKCPELVIVRPRMQRYIEISLMITRIFESYTDLVEPYSIDEQFLDITGVLHKYESAEALAKKIQHEVLLSTGVWCRTGIGPTKILAKMATDNFAKKHPDGIFRLGYDNLETDLWPLPVNQMFMVASKMTAHFWIMGCQTIGDIARMTLPDFKRRLRQRMGRQSDIQAEYYWQTARGLDPSPVVPSIRNELQSVSHGKTLRASLYTKREDIEIVLSELVTEVCRRARKIGKQGRVVAVGLGESDGTGAARFGRQVTLPHATSLTHEVGAASLRLFRANWQGMPVSHIYVSLTQLSDDDVTQLTLFDDRARAYDLERAVDSIKDRFGSAAILKASSHLEAGVARERAGQIGGHFK
ncbi:DNA polymerase IV [Cohnella soli]|uniref:DNA polymerase IV n=1 Tax=Cohnella soli TaxID=425005 RepID=A0ABW0HVP5_9BACL